MSDATQALTQLLDTWRAARHESTSELIHLVGSNVDFDAPSLTKKSQRAAAVDWLEATAREGPATLSQRLVQLEAVLGDWSAANLWPIFEALAARPADPRIATLATRLLVRDVRSDLTDKFRRRLVTCVEVHGDLGHWRALEVGFITNGVEMGLVQRYRRLLAAGLAARPDGPEIPAGERAAYATQVWEVGEAPVTEPDLFAHVYEDPTDLSRRQVLADALLERGDPRGEFIALQLSGNDEKRQAALIKRHGKEWSGPFAKVADDVRFEGGFITSVRLKRMTQARFAVLASAREWATVKRVTPGIPRLTRTMISLEDPGAVSEETLRSYVRDKLSLPIKHLHLDELNDAMLPTLKSFQRLETLSVPVSSLRLTEHLLMAAWPALKAMELRTQLFDLGMTAWLGLRQTMVPSTLTLTAAPGDALELHRTPEGIVVHLKHVANLFDAVRWRSVGRVVHAHPTRVTTQFFRPPTVAQEAALRSLFEPLGIPVEWRRG